MSLNSFHRLFSAANVAQLFWIMQAAGHLPCIFLVQPLAAPLLPSCLHSSSSYIMIPSQMPGLYFPTSSGWNYGLIICFRQKKKKMWEVKCNPSRWLSQHSAASSLPRSRCSESAFVSLCSEQSDYNKQGSQGMCDEWKMCLCCNNLPGLSTTTFTYELCDFKRVT